MPNSNIVVVHLTSVHPRYDTRIFLKECSGLAAVGYETYLIVADGLGNELVNNVNIYDVGRLLNGGRLGRMLVTTFKVFMQALRLKADIFHFHDPELIPIGLLLKIFGKTVIYDVHEDLPKQLLEKTWLAPVLRSFISKFSHFAEKRAASFFDAICVATPSISDSFKGRAKRCEVVNNFPMLDELYSEDVKDKKSNSIVYVGAITERRGIMPLILAMKNTSLTLELMGDFRGEGLRASVENLEGWDHVKEYGLSDREQVKSIFAKSIAGVVTFLPEPNHVEAQPNKMFEYMSAGLAVVASDFPLWKDFIEGNNCGICVAPDDSKAISVALNYLGDNPDIAMEMGRNGRHAVETKYNWVVEMKKLLGLYKSIL